MKEAKFFNGDIKLWNIDIPGTILEADPPGEIPNLPVNHTRLLVGAVPHHEGAAMVIMMEVNGQRLGTLMSGDEFEAFVGMITMANEACCNIVEGNSSLSPMEPIAIN